jgi:hypothetical protein
MRKAIFAGLLGGILAISLASGGISIDTWAFWLCGFACGVCLNLAHD